MLISRTETLRRDDLGWFVMNKKGNHRDQKTMSSLLTALLLCNFFCSLSLKATNDQKSFDYPVSGEASEARRTKNQRRLIWRQTGLEMSRLRWAPTDDTYSTRRERRSQTIRRWMFTEAEETRKENDVEIRCVTSVITFYAILPFPWQQYSVILSQLPDEKPALWIHWLSVCCLSVRWVHPITSCWGPLWRITAEVTCFQRIQMWQTWKISYTARWTSTCWTKLWLNGWMYSTEG